MLVLKKTLQLFILVLIGSLILTACQSESDTSEENNDNQDEVTSDQSDSGSDNDVTKNETEDEDKTDESNEEENGEDSPSTTEEVVEVSYQINQGNWRVEPISDEVDEKVALLTIDDAPDQHAVEMAHILKELDVPAIFFVNGHFLETEEKHDNLKEIYDLGFSIGNHTYNHPNLKELPVSEQEEQLVKLNDKVEEIIGERPAFFRAPFGANTEDSLAIADSEGMVVMNWTYGYDWEKAYQDSQALADIMVNTEYLNDGANLLMHDREWTKDALKDIVTGLRDKGYTFVNPQAIKGVE